MGVSIFSYVTIELSMPIFIVLLCLFLFTYHCHVLPPSSLTFRFEIIEIGFLRKYFKIFDALNNGDVIPSNVLKQPSCWYFRVQEDKV